MTPTLKMYSNFVLPSWTTFSHIMKCVVQWPAVCDSWSLYCNNTRRAKAILVYIRCTLASLGLWLAHVWFLKIVSMQESVCVCLCVCACAPEATINREIFAKISCGFQEYHKFFLWIFILYKLCMIVFFKCCKRKAPRKFSHEKLYWLESTKV